VADGHRFVLSQFIELRQWDISILDRILTLSFNASTSYISPGAVIRRAA
jgi:hypothetical protein